MTAVALFLLAMAPMTRADESTGPPMPDSGKLLATGGVSEVEGAGGGGLTPWALITGYGTKDSYGANVHYTELQTQDYRLTSPGVSFGLFDRVELSLAHQDFVGTGAALDAVRIRQDIVGLKVRVAGDAVYDQTSLLPQIALGTQIKTDHGVFGLESLGVHNASDLGAKSNSGTDFYVAATKVFLNESILTDFTLRFTKANEFGLLGFGGDRNDAYRAEPEFSLAYLFSRKLAAGVEYRAKPHNLSIDDEHDAYDLFVAWFPSHNLSFTLAYVDLGSIVKPFNPTNQQGFYISAQVGF